jgi:hypothetical protein
MALRREEELVIMSGSASTYWRGRERTRRNRRAQGHGEDIEQVDSTRIGAWKGMQPGLAAREKAVR